MQPPRDGSDNNTHHRTLESPNNHNISPASNQHHETPKLLSKTFPKHKSAQPQGDFLQILLGFLPLNHVVIN